MVITQVLLLLLLAVLSVWVLVVLVRVQRGAAKGRLYSEMLGVLYDAPEGAGISVLCSCAGEAPDISNLLDVGYSRYEVVLVVDAEVHAEDFAALAARYALIRVNFSTAEARSVKGVRGLYRSRKRCFRRLVVVDKRFTTIARDLDAAVGAAAFDYLFPMCAGRELMPYAIVRLAAELGGHPRGGIDLVCSHMGVPAMLLNREQVAAAGGFGMEPWRSIPRRRRVVLYEPLLRPDRPVRQHGRWYVGWGLPAAGIAAAAAGWWMACVVLLTVAVMWAAVRVAGPLIVRGTEYTVNGSAVIGFLFRNFNVKNFTIS